MFERLIKRDKAICKLQVITQVIHHFFVHLIENSTKCQLKKI